MLEFFLSKYLELQLCKYIYVFDTSIEVSDILINDHFWFSDESEIRSPASVDSSTSCTSSNNAASTNELASNLPEWMIEGERILLRKSNLSGTIAYIGTIEFASGIWIGIELDVPVGTCPSSFIYKRSTCIHIFNWMSSKIIIYSYKIDWIMNSKYFIFKNMKPSYE